VTQLRKKMLEEIQRRDYSKSTARIYLHVISDFARYFRRSPDLLGPEHIRHYQVHLFVESYRHTQSDNTQLPYVSSISRLFAGTFPPSTFRFLNIANDSPRSSAPRRSLDSLMLPTISFTAP
jgi:Phage integrase, N-terminal SAM-like domain